MMTNKYDIIILGGGNAGFGVSAVASEAGKSIAFVEQRDFGGTCPNRGCTPKKVLVAAAHALHEIETASAHHIEVSKAKLNWTKLIQREKDMISFIPDAMAGVAEKRGDVYRGTAKFVGPNSIDVDGNILTADNIVIATGSKTRPLPIPGAELMITSEDVLSEETQPTEVVFIGGGVIAMEFSHVYARAGTKVTILEVMPRLLPRVEADAVTAIQGESERIGITIKTGVKVKSVAKSGDRLSVTYEFDGIDHTIETDRVINGAGRIANVDGLDLDAGNVKHDRIAIDVDQYLRSTSNPSVWVAGDALVTSPQLSPIASYEGKIVGENIVNGATKPPDYAVIPSAIYTIPALSTVGLTEEDAKNQGLNVSVKTSDMREWFSGKSYAETVAFAKVLVDQDKDRIVGAHMVGHQAEELIHLFAMAMRHNIPASSLKEDMFAFPTFSSDIKNLI
ncbi:MAG: NAD(P)/FAD-dependent oxidoreductase [Cohaesibacteraceae bacterium]|nr:NAD(P)/FAD-dependent oxidoreductase [Cohaesibacteraceae bacterium]